MQDPSAPPLLQTHRPPRPRVARWRKRALLVARCLIYPLDCLVLRGSLRVLSWLGYTAVVCDRYVYDKIANLPRPDGPLARLICWIAPAPNSAFVIDVPPQVARQRRDEHPAGYHETKYAAYRRVVAARAELRAIRKLWDRLSSLSLTGWKAGPTEEFERSSRLRRTRSARRPCRRPEAFALPCEGLFHLPLVSTG
jgi:hypothetical protein